jgi:hypothetical protein
MQSKTLDISVIIIVFDMMHVVTQNTYIIIKYKIFLFNVFIFGHLKLIRNCQDGNASKLTILQQ